MPSSTPSDYMERTGEKARGYFLFWVGCLIGMIFLLIALVVGIIGVGLQIEQHGAVSFTGLMISATIFAGISILVFIVSAILMVAQKQKLQERQRARERQQATGSHIAPLFEDILKQILMNLVQKKKAPDHERSSDSN